MLDEDQSFSLTANVMASGWQSVVLRGYLVRRTPEGTYIAPLIPQLFYGVDGQQLTSWRQYIPEAGEQVILYRNPEDPDVPREELWWRRVPSREETVRTARTLVEQAAGEVLALPDLRPLLILGALALVLLWGK